MASLGDVNMNEKAFLSRENIVPSWRVYLYGIQLSVAKLGWISGVIFRSLVNRITEPADATSAGFSVSFGLDFVWEKTIFHTRTPMISYYPTVPMPSNKIQIRYAKEFGISAATRHFGTTRATVRRKSNSHHSDIPEFRYLRRLLNLLQWQFSLRDVATGLVFFGYSQEKSNFTTGRSSLCPPEAQDTADLSRYLHGPSHSWGRVLLR